MVARVNPCDPARLRLLADDRLAPIQLTEVEEHLQGCPACRAALDRLADGDRWLGAARHYLGGDPAVTAGETVSPCSYTLDFLAPSDWPDSLGRLGVYEVTSVLGRGGMGIVLKAFDPSLNRNVAVKVLSSHLATSAAARQRFLREARAAAAVVQEHVVAVYAVDQAGGLPYLVMEYVSGHSLQDRLDEHGQLSLLEILRIGMQAASGLAAAHAQGLVHRDVKPANILLENGVERARLTDFGLARAAADAGLTQTGTVVGTPHFMAPEQARGEPVDHRADLFSLGSTLYAMCAGYPPFRAESPLAVVRRVSDDEPRPIREANPEVPIWLEAIIARLQAKDPERRFQTAAEVADLLSRCLAHVQQPLTVPLPSNLTAATSRTNRPLLPRRWSRRAVLAFVAIIAGSFAFMPQHQLVPNLVDHEGNTSTNSVHSGADAIDKQIGRLSLHLGTVEADIHRPEDHGTLDSMTALVNEWARQAKALEREINSLSPPFRGQTTVSPHNPYLGDDR
jgi:serine/threonine protein kinase